MHDRQDSAGPNRSLEDAYARAAVFAAHAHRALNRASSAASRLLVWARDGAGYLGLAEPQPNEKDRPGQLRGSKAPPELEWTQLGEALGTCHAPRLRLSSSIPSCCMRMPTWPRWLIASLRLAPRAMSRCC